MTPFFQGLAHLDVASSQPCVIAEDSRDSPSPKTGLYLPLLFQAADSARRSNTSPAPALQLFGKSIRVVPSMPRQHHEQSALDICMETASALHSQTPPGCCGAANPSTSGSVPVPMGRLAGGPTAWLDLLSRCGPAQGVAASRAGAHAGQGLWGNERCQLDNECVSKVTQQATHQVGLKRSHAEEDADTRALGSIEFQEQKRSRRTMGAGPESGPHRGDARGDAMLALALESLLHQQRWPLLEQQTSSLAACQQLATARKEVLALQQRNAVLERQLAVAHDSLDHSRLGLQAAEEEAVLLRRYLRDCIHKLQTREREEGCGECEGPQAAAEDDAQSKCDDPCPRPTDKEALQEGSLQGKCWMCWNRPATVLLIPCRHLALCRVCEPNITACPTCMEGYKAVIHVRTE